MIPVVCQCHLRTQLGAGNWDTKLDLNALNRFTDSYGLWDSRIPYQMKMAINLVALNHAFQHIL